MAGSLVTVSAKTFFDRPAVQRAAGRFGARWLSRAGAFIMRAARSSMRKRKAVSEPGQPPSVHAGHLKKGIVFGFEAGRKTVVIGPTPAWRQASSGGELRGASLLEFGGVVTRRRRNVPSGGRRLRRMRYRARPFMGPALVRGMEDLGRKYPTELPRLWATSVRG
jgi:hypothetical protein